MPQKVKKPEPKEAQEERRKKEVKNIQEAKREEGARKIQEAKMKQEAKTQQEAKRKRKAEARKRRRARKRQKAIEQEAMEEQISALMEKQISTQRPSEIPHITDLEEDVLIYGICNSMNLFKHSRRVDVLREFRMFAELGLDEDSRTVSIDQIGKNCKMTKPKQLSGVISSLSKKGLIKHLKNDTLVRLFYDGGAITLTEKGVSLLEVT